MTGKEAMGATILVVDDKPANVKLLFDALKGLGYRTLAALDGEGAVRQAELARPDLILMDVMMGGIDGFEACRQLKKNPVTRDIPVIFMTARTETADKLEGFRAGGVDYLTKPLQHDEALARIEAHLGRYRLWADVGLYTEALLGMGSAPTPEEALDALGRLAEKQKEAAGLALWVAGGGRLRLAHARGLERKPAEDWKAPETAHAEGRQLAAADEEDWKPHPAWAQKSGARGYVLTPVACRGERLGVLGMFFAEPPGRGFAERTRWLRILADGLGNALMHARSLEEIERLSEQLREENALLREEVTASAGHGLMVGESPALRRVLEQVALAAPTEAPILVLGESGTGKELLAQTIHERSRRSGAPMIRVNCAAIPRELFESEFFGHVKGSFTGAVKDRAGRFELADGGTLFLDEVGEIPLELQGKLLRVLQEGTFERIGEEKTRKVDVRIVAATNRDLKQAATDGRFRQDLYYRLSVFPVTLPSLRERREDVPALVRHFAGQYARKAGLPPPEIGEDALGAFMEYSWPGNVRELQNEVERAMILARGGKPTFAAPGGGVGIGAQGGGGFERIVSESEWQGLQRENVLRALRARKGACSGWRGRRRLVSERTRRTSPMRAASRRAENSGGKGLGAATGLGGGDSGEGSDGDQREGRRERSMARRESKSTGLGRKPSQPAQRLSAWVWS